jgi:hypothetical protein
LAEDAEVNAGEYGMNDRPKLWSSRAWLNATRMPDAPVEPPVELVELLATEQLPAAARVEMVDTQILPTIRDATIADAPTQKLPAMLSAPSHPSRVPAVAKTAATRRRAPSRRTATAATLVFIVLVNVGLQLNRRPFDVLGAAYAEAALPRIQRCESLGQRPDVLYLGSSRVMHGVSPAVVDATVEAQFQQRVVSCNAGEDDSTFEEDYYTLKRVIADGYAPKLVVEGLWDYDVDAHGSPLADSAPLPASQIQTIADATDVGALKAHFAGGIKGGLAQANFVAQKLIPMYGARVGMFRAICGSLDIGPCATATQGSVVATPLQKMVLPSDRQGWSALVGRSLATMSPTPETQYPTCGTSCRPFVIGGKQMGYLAQLVALAKAHGVRVALVETPLSRYYVSHLFFAADWQTLSTYWSEFAGQQGAAFYDESQALEYTDADFWDIHHLDADGAAKFSAWIGTTIVGGLLLGRTV